MKIALFSDIHGNISGLKAVLHAIDNAGGADMMIAAGDLIGGGPGTDDLLDLLQERQVKMLRGNAEEVWLDINEAWNQMYDLWKEMEPERDFDLEREKWMDELRPTAEWMQSHLSKSNFDLLAQLPMSMTVEAAPNHRLLVCHATPDSPWPPITGPSTPSQILHETYGRVDADVIAFGHVHQHHTRTLGGKLLINIASVQERKDVPGNSAFTWLKYEVDNWVVEQILVPYDTVEEARLTTERQVPRL